MSWGGIGWMMTLLLMTDGLLRKGFGDMTEGIWFKYGSKRKLLNNDVCKSNLSNLVTYIVLYGHTFKGREHLL